MPPLRQSMGLPRLTCCTVMLVASAGVCAQTITMQAAGLPLPVPPWVVAVLSILLAATGYAILRGRVTKSLPRLSGLPLLAILWMAALAATLSGDWVSRAYASVCSNCSYTLTQSSETFGPVAWDTDIAVTNQTRPFDTANVYVTCPSYAPCGLVTPLTSPATPQCQPGLVLATGATCVLRVETRAGKALRSGGANKYVAAGVIDGALSAIAAAPGPALEQFVLETVSTRVVLRSIGNGKYFLVHGDAFVYADAAAPAAATAWVVFLVDGSGAESQVVILEDGPASANVNVLQYDPASKNLRVVALPVVSALNDPNSQFYFSPPLN